jgi:hypothetical protein
MNFIQGVPLYVNKPFRWNDQEYETGQEFPYQALGVKWDKIMRMFRTRKILPKEMLKHDEFTEAAPRSRRKAVRSEKH